MCTLVGRVGRKLGGRKGEDEPTSARVDRVESECVAEERTSTFGVVCEDDRVNAVIIAAPSLRGAHYSRPGGRGLLVLEKSQVEPAQALDIHVALVNGAIGIVAFRGSGSARKSIFSTILPCRTVTPPTENGCPAEARVHLRLTDHGLGRGE
jgi:hypothetical protein